MDTTEITASIAGATLILNIILITIDRVTRRNLIDQKINDAISNAKLDAAMTKGEIQNDIYDAFEKLRLEIKKEYIDFTNKFSDSLPAVRQKINDVEIWARDEFVRREDFNRAIDSFNLNLQTLGDKLEAKIEQIK